MTAETDVKQRLAALRATLAKATKACPGKAMHPEGFGIHSAGCEHHCQGTGEVAMFEGFRQVCPRCIHNAKSSEDLHYYSGSNLLRRCPDCKNTRWQVRAGGMEAALEGLSKPQARQALMRLYDWLWWNDPSEPTPDRATILVKALELVCEVAEMEVPDEQN